MQEGIELSRGGEIAATISAPLYMRLLKLHCLYCGAVLGWFINLGFAVLFCLIPGESLPWFSRLLLCFFMVWPFIVISRILRAMLLYKYWKLVPAERADVTPGDAVILLFVPIFNLYWNFVSILGLGKFLSAETGSRAPKTKAFTYSIVCVVFGFTTVFILNPLSELIMMMSFFKAVKRWQNWR